MKKTMQLTTRMLLAMAVIVTMLCGQKEEVYAAVDRSTALYEWHRVQSVEELKKAKYEKKWVPIIIVADYESGGDYPAVSYYLNRETPIGYSDRTSTEVPVMNTLSGGTRTGLLLKMGMKKLEAGEKSFVTRGDMGAMHMYYHGYCRKPVGTSYSLQADAWSLTNDKNVEDYSDASVSQVYGLAVYNSYYELDQNVVVSWNGKGGVPKTRSVRTNSYETSQAWTFLNNTTDGSANGYFKICNVLGMADSDTGISYAYAPTWGGVLNNSSRFSSPDPNSRNVLSTPSRAAAYTANGPTNYQGAELNRVIFSQYNYKYSENWSRAKFSIYIGKQIEGDFTVKSQNVNGKLNWYTGAVIPEGSVIRVKKGGLVYIAADSEVFFDGKIILEGGTLIVGARAVVSSQRESTDWKLYQCGSIEDAGTDRSKLLVMDDATLCLNSTLSLQNTDVVNLGVIVVPGEAKLAGSSTVQMGEDSRLAAGFGAWTPKTLAESLKKEQAKGVFEAGAAPSMYGTEVLAVPGPGYYTAVRDMQKAASLAVRENASVVLEGDQSKIFNYFMSMKDAAQIAADPDQAGAKAVQYADTSGNISNANMRWLIQGEWDTYTVGSGYKYCSVYSGK